MVLLRQQKLGTTNKFFVAATKNFAAVTKRFVDRTKHSVVVTKYFCLYFNEWFGWYKKIFYTVFKTPLRVFYFSLQFDVSWNYFDVRHATRCLRKVITEKPSAVKS